ncbi:polysaccharide biosynthesis protein, partial [candidate division KSB1 bacterium]|nr:polysaccharide biosynthesis protein [candidate division KSB1 bacterium]
MWRYTSLTDVINIARGSLSASFILAAFYLFSGLFQGFPRSVFVIDLILSSFFLATVRASIRIYFLRQSKGGFLPLFLKENNEQYARLIIIGAGDAGEKILREIMDSRYAKYSVFGFVDDDPAKKGSTIHGVYVLGNTDDLITYKDQYDEILICMPSASSEKMRNIVDKCKATGKKFRTLPGIWELIDGSVSIKQIRDVSIVDLLGRKEVRLDRDSISRFISQKNVLITGAGGSIGSELARQCFTFAPKTLILLDIGEFNLFQIEQELSQLSGTVNIVYVLADIKNMTTTERIFQKYKPEIVLHAAAYKHVPIQESYPWEAIITNVYGTLNLVSLGDKYNLDSFVMVSTDKAVRPTNIMGASKRIAELGILASAEKMSPKFMSVRFGNVIGSSGSVIPIFQQQIAKGGPVTVTHRDMKRYFMSIPEASQLILQAGAIGKGGETFLLDMGEPVKIDTVARDLIRLSGFKPDIDIEIQYSGIRPGEKMFEE